jgi:hypothetical protein
VKSAVAVEKGTNGVISINFSFCGGRTFNTLRANLFADKSPKRIFQQPRLITAVGMGRLRLGSSSHL